MAGLRRRTGLAMAILPAVAALALAACGGGGGGGGSTTAALAETGNAELQQYMQGPQTASYALGLVGADTTGGFGSQRLP